ncbi:hypothetical protein P2G72_02400 [Cronobacter sakazakii]|nr:hypothetical protein [Cronobacter sakazakii]MEB8628642.1 hypothetical protein [Cronobacter sakazakii]
MTHIKVKPWFLRILVPVTRKMPLCINLYSESRVAKTAITRYYRRWQV